MSSNHTESPQIDLTTPQPEVHLPADASETELLDRIVFETAATCAQNANIKLDEGLSLDQQEALNNFLAVLQTINEVDAAHARRLFVDILEMELIEKYRAKYFSSEIVFNQLNQIVERYRDMLQPERANASLPDEKDRQAYFDKIKGLIEKETFDE